MKNVEDLYPLTPMQRIMLLHALTAAGRDTLFNQFCYEVRGDVDPVATATAWQQVIDRHTALRTAFVWEGIPDPIQVVRQRADVKLEFVDLSGDDPDVQIARREEFRAADRELGFDLGKAPLMRVGLLQTAPDRAWLVWSSHHLILDRWCIHLVLDDFRAFFEGAKGRPTALAPARKYRDYVGWIQRQDRERARAFWSDEVHGISHAARTIVDTAARGANELATARFSTDRSQALRATARSLRVTPSTLFQAAWALVLHERSRQRDVVFGATVSGRPADLPGVESIVGSFISNVPVRVQLRDEETVRDWLSAFHRRQQERAPFEYLSANEIHELSGLFSNEPLFDSLFVWLAPTTPQNSTGIELRALPGELETAWPVTVSVADEPNVIVATVRCPKTSDVDAESLVAALERNVTELVSDADRRLSQLESFVPAPTQPGATGGNGRVTTPATRLEELRAEAAQGREDEELAMVEDMLLAECRSLLESDSYHREDNFFECGGNSLLGAQLHARIEMTTGRQIPILSLFQTPTCAGMARFLTQRRWPVLGGMVRAVQPKGSRTPLMCISSPEVNSIGYMLLSRHLHPDQPVYLVQSPPKSDEVLRMAITQIPDFAEDYYQAIREARPHGPYRLLGMCDGALIALEIARKLREAGETVEFFGVLNTYSLNTLSRLNYARRVEVRLRYYASRFADFRRLDWHSRRSELSRILRRRIGTIGSTLRGSSNKDTKQDPPPRSEPIRTEDPAAAGPSPEAVHREWQQLDWPKNRPPRPIFDGRVTVFRIQQQPYFRIRDEMLGWGKQAESVELVYLEAEEGSRGNERKDWRDAHLDILREPGVRKTAAAINSCLDKLAEQPKA